MSEESSSDSGDPALHQAILQMDTEKVLKLLSEGYDSNVTNKFKITPLHIAARLSDDAGACYIEPLLQHKASINSLTIDGETPLYMACRMRNWICAKLLLDNGAREVLSDDGFLYDSLLHMLVDRSAPENLIVQLLGTGVSVDRVDDSGETALRIAVGYSDRTVARVLLEHGASPDISDSWGRTPLSVSCLNHDLKMFNLLLPYTKMDLDAQVDRRGNRLVHYALSGYDEDDEYYEKSKIIQRLLELGVSVNIPDSEGTLPIHLAIELSDVPSALKVIELTSIDAVVKSLQDHPQNQKNLLSLGIIRNEPLIFKAIKAKGFPPYVLSQPIFAGSENFGPVAYAAYEWGSLPLNCNPVKVMMDLGIPIEFQFNSNEDNVVGSVAAAVRCHSDHCRADCDCHCLGTIEFLLESGADPDFTHNDEFPKSYKYAVNCKSANILGLLLQYSWKINIDELLLYCLRSTDRPQSLIEVPEEDEIKNHFGWAYFLSKYTIQDHRQLFPDYCRNVSWNFPSLTALCRHVVRKDLRHHCTDFKSFKSYFFEDLPIGLANYVLYSDLYPNGRVKSKSPCN